MTAPKNKIRATPLGVLRHYWRVADVKAWHLVLPILLILIASAFEGASFSLLLPLKDAVAQNSFDFLEQSRAFGWLPRLVPDGLDPSARDAYLVLCIAVLMILGRIGKLGLQFTAGLVVTARNERAAQDNVIRRIAADVNFRPVQFDHGPPAFVHFVEPDLHL